MRVARFIGIVCIGVGLVWILQGVNLLGGSFMSGQAIWAIIGALVVAVGIGLLRGAARSRSRARDDE